MSKSKLDTCVIMDCCIYTDDGLYVIVKSNYRDFYENWATSIGGKIKETSQSYNLRTKKKKKKIKKKRKIGLNSPVDIETEPLWHSYLRETIEEITNLEIIPYKVLQNLLNFTKPYFKPFTVKNCGWLDKIKTVQFWMPRPTRLFSKEFKNFAPKNLTQFMENYPQWIELVSKDYRFHRKQYGKKIFYLKDGSRKSIVLRRIVGLAAKLTNSGNSEDPMYEFVTKLLENSNQELFARKFDYKKRFKKSISEEIKYILKLDREKLDELIPMHLNGEIRDVYCPISLVIKREGRSKKIICSDDLEKFPKFKLFLPIQAIYYNLFLENTEQEIFPEEDGFSQSELEAVLDNEE